MTTTSDNLDYFRRDDSNNESIVHILDNQGRLIQQAMNGLVHCLTKDIDPEKLIFVLATARTVFSEHFAYQDQLMQKHGYPGVEDHQWRHRDILNRIERIQSLLAMDDWDHAKKQINILAQDVDYHCAGADHKLLDFVRELCNMTPRNQPVRELHFLSA